MMFAGIGAPGKIGSIQQSGAEACPSPGWPTSQLRQPGSCAVSDKGCETAFSKTGWHGPPMTGQCSLITCRRIFVVTASAAPASTHSKRQIHRHPERREGPDPMTARQPGEAAKVPRSARKRGRCGKRQRNQWLPSSTSLQHRTPTGELRLGKTRKKTTPQFEVLITGEFYGSVDSWTEYLCLARNGDGSITLSSRSREILAEAAKYRKRGWLPTTIRRKEVSGFDGDYVVGKRLLLHDGEAEITVCQNQFDVAAEWLIRRKWNLQDQFGKAWARIRSALYAPGCFSAEKPLPLSHSGADHSWGGSHRIEYREIELMRKSESQPAGHKPRQIIIRAAGPAKPWIIWLELVFVEESGEGFSVYARTGEAIGGSTEQYSGLMPRAPDRLNWRSVLQFVRSHDLADLSGVLLDEVVILGVQPWQRDVITAAMLRLSAIVPFLSRLSGKELKSLHERLAGFLPEESLRLLNRLAAATRPLGRWSLANIARLVGSSDPMDAGRLAESRRGTRWSIRGSE